MIEWLEKSVSGGLVNLLEAQFNQGDCARMQILFASCKSSMVSDELLIGTLRFRQTSG